MKKKILLIEDETGIRMPIKDELEFEGFEVQVREDGLQGLESILSDRPDLVVLDLMLPGKNGFEICQEVRRRGIDTPIIMLTARTQEVDKVRGLNLGADDYVIKPFSLAELVARIRAVLRRSQESGMTKQQEAHTFQLGELRVETRSQEVFQGEKKIKLARKEFQMLVLLLQRPGEVITRDEFLNVVWGEDVYVSHRTVDTHMVSLRKKLEDDPKHPQHILSVRGIGYKLNTDLTVS